MRRIVTIVEGHGEVEAVPILLRRIAAQVSPETVPDLPRPIRVKRNRIMRPGELERAVELAAGRAGQGGCILLLLDANGDCPRELAADALARAAMVRPDRTVGAVLAKTEYEAWFLAAAASLAGKHGIAATVAPPKDPEAIRNAKGWLRDRMPPGQSYRETLHQAALTAMFDLDQARTASSFDKLWRTLTWLLSIPEDRE